MPKSTPSMQARAAKEVRQYLKAQGIKGKVTSSSGAGTTSINVDLLNPTPAIAEQVKTFTKQYQYGHFDGMTDSYEYSNTVEGRPQVRFAFVRSDFDAETKQAALDALADAFELGELDYTAMPYSATICGEQQDLYSAVRQVLTGCHYPHVPFWETEAA